MKKNSDQTEICYQCGTCQFMLRQKRTDPPPSYCPNCAIHNLKGMMALVEETKESSIGPHVSTSQTSRRLC